MPVEHRHDVVTEEFVWPDRGFDERVLVLAAVFREWSQQVLGFLIDFGA